MAWGFKGRGSAGSLETRKDLYLRVGKRFGLPKIEDTAVPRALSHYTASPSPRPISQAAPTSRLEWISSQGLLDAECAELPIRRSSIPHLIGVRGYQIWLLEERLGVVIGVMDLGEEGALVSLLGPPDCLLVARRVVELVSKGVRTFGEMGLGPLLWVGTCCSGRDLRLVVIWALWTSRFLDFWLG